MLWLILWRMNYLAVNSMGCLKGRSTVLQLLNIIDDWSLKLESGGQIDSTGCANKKQSLRKNAEFQP